MVFTVLIYMNDQRVKYNLKVFDVFDGMALLLRLSAVGYIIALVV